jgi:hypothetical protein
MPKPKLICLFLFSSLLLASPVLASDTVISNNVHTDVNGGNASSNVSITNNIGADSTSVSNTTSGNCDIVIDSNGDHKEYHGNCGDINLQSGSNSVKVNHNNSVPPATIHPAATPNPITSASPSASPTASPTPSASPAPQTESTNIWDEVKKLVENLLKNL